MADQDLIVRIIGDDADLQRALTRSQRNVQQFGVQVGGIGKLVGRAFIAAGIAVGAAEITRGIAGAIKAASDLNEEVAKTGQVFGDSSTQIEIWSESTARSIGVAQQQALAAAGTFGNLFNTVGLGQQAAADMSQELVQLAADLASFNNADITDVLLAIRSGLIGEAEPLRRFGVLLSETRVQQDAMAASGKDNVKELTNQEKALARFNIILTDTQSAQGDFARTSEGAANQTRILSAQLSDLSAELGGKLLPGLVKVVGATNDLIDVFTQAGDSLDPRLGETVQDVDIQVFVDMRDRLAEIKGEGDDVVHILDQIIERLRAVQGVVIGGPDSRGGLRGPGAIVASNAIIDEKNRLEEIQRQKREAKRAGKEFDEFVQGMGLKLDKAGLTAGLADDLAVLKELEKAILRRIKEEGRTFDLVQQLTDVRAQIAATVQTQADNARQAAEDAYQAVIESLSLDLDRAGVTKSLQDDLAVMEEIERAIKVRIAAEGRTTELLQQLFNVQQQQAETRKQIAENTRTRKQERQFEALGLTAEGEKRIPGAGALRRRLGSIRDAVEGTFLDTPKTQAQLDRIAAVLTGKFGKVGKEVREAILGMFSDIAGALDEGSKKGPLTKESGLDTAKFLEGLGLSPDQIRELRGRLSSLTVEGKQARAFQLGAPATATAGFGGAQGPVLVESHTTINLDGQRVAKVVTRNQQKAKARNPTQKRGPNRSRNL